MPEGDTIHAAAGRLRRSLGGVTIEKVGGSHPAVRRDGRRLQGRTVRAVEARGKHLLVRFDHGWTLRTHLGMTGRWDTYGPGERWRASPGKARVVLEGAGVVAVCFAAPTVEIAPDAIVDRGLARLGPDLLGDDFDEDRFVTRASAAGPATVADLLLDQHLMAGVGNVIKCEVLFAERIHPATPAAALDDAGVRGLARRARKLLQANRDGGPRTTTGLPGDRNRLWVYGRSRLPCRRCRTEIVEGWVGDPPRITYWCPGCQPVHP